MRIVTKARAPYPTSGALYRKGNGLVNDFDLLKTTNFEFLGPKKTGKVRDIYDRSDTLILITADRHSSFDRIIGVIRTCADRPSGGIVALLYPNVRANYWREIRSRRNTNSTAY